MEEKPPFLRRLRTLLIGAARDPYDQSLFHRISLIAFFAWIGLGADGLSSCCYGPEEAFLALVGHPYLSLFVAGMSVITILVISTGYSQIIELFPSGGGGYLVASKLLSPGFGVVSGCALLVDYVLTIAISVASGADAIFSFLPNDERVQRLKLVVAIIGVLLLVMLNLRGAKESISILMPIFMAFVLTHLFAIVYAVFIHPHTYADVGQGLKHDVGEGATIGWFVLIGLVLRAYSMGAGTYTGIEAVSNGVSILREPRVQTGKRTMRYMAWSLAFTVMGLMLAYLLYDVHHQEGRTLNATLFHAMADSWDNVPRDLFIYIALISEAALLFVAAQAGFMDGPRVLANMALDKWVPTRFAMLSDRFVTHNGILMVGGAAVAVMLLTGGSVKVLVVLYSINVFITFTLSQSGMVRHWWSVRGRVPHWRKKLFINSLGALLCATILCVVIYEKFTDWGWVTLVITGGVIALVWMVHRHYQHTAQVLRRLDQLVRAAEMDHPSQPAGADPPFNPSAKTAVLLVNGFNGLGLHVLFAVARLFGDMFKNFVFVEVGIIDAGVFKGAEEIAALEAKVNADLDRYTQYMRRHGFHAQSISTIGTDVVGGLDELTPEILKRFPNSMFFGGQLLFPNESFLIRWLHNYTAFAMQRRFYQQGIPFVLLPIRVQ